MVWSGHQSLALDDPIWPMPDDTAAETLANPSASDPSMALSCRSCATTLQGPFCHACGVKAPRLPLTLRALLQDFAERVLHVEKRLKRTLGHLCWQPAAVFAAFLRGQRLSYTHPLPFLVAIATLSVLLSHLFGDAYFDLYRAKMLEQVNRSLSPARAALYAQLNVWLGLSMPYWMLIFSLPAAGLMRLLFTERDFTVAEAWAVGLYGIAMAMLVGLAVNGLGLWAGMPLLTLQLVADALLLLVTIGYYLAWLGLGPATVLRVAAACLIGFVLMNQLQELTLYQIAAWLPGVG